MAIPTDDEIMETTQECDAIYQEEDKSNAGHVQCTDDEKSQTSIPTNTRNNVIKQKTTKSNYVVLVTIISCVMTIVQTLQSEFMNIFKKHTDSNSLFHDHRNKMSWMTLKSKRDYYMPKCKAWLNRFVRPFHFYPKTFLKTYLLDPEEYNKFVDQQKSKQSSYLNESMQFEWCRLSSFASYPNTNISVIKLAKAGYYYNGNGDEVICYFCKSKHKHWKSTDDPKEIHKGKTPECPFVIKHLSATSKQNHVTIPACDGAHSSAGACGNAADTKNLSVVSDKHCEFVGEQGANEARANHDNTFTVDRNNENNTAPVDRNHEHIVTVERNITSTRNSEISENLVNNVSDRQRESSEAISSHIGTEDHCRCFFCGGGLRRWEEGDLPWTEHARWYPKCPFVIQCKGEKFIEDVQKGQNPEITENLAENKPKKSPLGINGFKNNPAVQTILDFGYESNVVKAAYTRLKESGIHDISASLLLDTIYEKAESENHNATSDQAIACPNSIPMKEPDDKELSNKTPENIEKIDPTLELSIRNLEKENRNLKDQQTCKICLDEPVAIVFLPCGHMAACINCAPALRRCPICRAFIKGTVKAIMC
ncbi:putative inhibitor of apoptosis [Mytilus trossulus]|uniref:putative inhibitor of apoptosis n=1 Tax=Mytilus trossulus TaxID=6551 RepID=UPI0030072B94